MQWNYVILLIITGVWKVAKGHTKPLPLISIPTTKVVDNGYHHHANPRMTGMTRVPITRKAVPDKPPKIKWTSNYCNSTTKSRICKHKPIGIQGDYCEYIFKSRQNRQLSPDKLEKSFCQCLVWFVDFDCLNSTNHTNRNKSWNSHVAWNHWMNNTTRRKSTKKICKNQI